MKTANSVGAHCMRPTFPSTDVTGRAHPSVCRGGAPTDSSESTGALQWLRAAELRLQAVGVASARLDARILLAEVLRIDPSALASGADRALDPQQSARAEALLRRRERREPISRILGRREFWSLEFKIS